MTALMLRPKDGQGRFVPQTLADLWSDQCDTCDEPKALHRGSKAIFDGTTRPFCPITIEDGELVLASPSVPVEELDGTSFDPCEVFGCRDPKDHEIGCDCAWG